MRHARETVRPRKRQLRPTLEHLEPRNAPGDLVFGLVAFEIPGFAPPSGITQLNNRTDDIELPASTSLPVSGPAGPKPGHQFSLVALPPHRAPSPAWQPTSKSGISAARGALSGGLDWVFPDLLADPFTPVSAREPGAGVGGSGGPSGVDIVDNESVLGFSTVGDWAGPFPGQGFAGSVHFAAKREVGEQEKTATWTFNLPGAGFYNVSVTWSPHDNRATNAPFTLFNDNTPVESVPVNQKLNPAADFTVLGTNFQTLVSSFETTTGVVKVRLTNDADGFVIADAVRVGDLYLRVVDDATPGAAFTTTTGFTAFSGQGYKNRVEFSEGGAAAGTNFATWSFAGLSPGRYLVSATWTAHENRFDAAQHTVRLGGVVQAVVELNQQVAPDDFNFNGAAWENIGTYNLTGTSLSVTLSNLGSAPGSGAGKYVIADAIRVERIGDLP